VSALEPDPSFEELLQFIRQTRGFDFTGYKRPSLVRRFERRLQVLRIKSWDDYRAVLESDPNEFAALFDTILINVTGFFRDPPMWRYLTDTVLPQIIGTEAGRPIRVWSAGCASGEEAYTTAMLLAEALPTHEFRTRVKIYATDADEAALATGRHASFPSASLDAVPEPLRERYFERAEDTVTVRPELRRAVIFGRHDLMQDPPISRVDLLTARNTLMYFNPDAQTRILAGFHFALRDSGFLFLGKSEMLMTRTKLFVPVDLRRRVFAKAPSTTREPAREERRRALPSVFLDGSGIRDAAFETSPVAQLVLDAEGNLALANLHARLLFGISVRDLGRPMQDLEVSYRPIELRSEIERAVDERRSIRIRGVEWSDTNGEQHVVDVQVAPLGPDDPAAVAVSFLDVTRFKQLQDVVEQTRQEGETAYEELQATFEELETTNEELQSTNEELETTNEELQSTNEELETINEELHSTNEELETINEELNTRTEELNDANAFLQSILASFSSAVLVIDRDHLITEWNGIAEELWGLRPDEVRRQHLLNLDIGLPVEKLRGPIKDVLATGEPQTLSVNAMNRRGRPVSCAIRITPLHGPFDETTRGAIILIDTELIETEASDGGDDATNAE
jgi:two-component system CheB/CheR fusion protein